MTGAFDELTVAQLKDKLREQNLPVSGNKSALIERLQAADEHGSAVQSDTATADAKGAPASVEVGSSESRPNTQTEVRSKHTFPCRLCGAMLGVPAGFEGEVRCPSCKTQQPVGRASGQGGDMPFGWTPNQVSVGLSFTGVLVGMLAIVVFFSAFGYEVACPPESRGETVIDGETYPTCDGPMWGGTLERLFYACCLMVPGSLFLTSWGQSMRRANERLSLASAENNDNFTSEGSPAGGSSSTPSGRLSDTAAMGILQRLAKWFGVGLSTLTVLLIVLAVSFLFFALWALLSGGSFSG